jgi:hypothetical protein
MRLALVILLALAGPALAEEPPVGAVAVPADTPAPPSLVELRRVKLRRHTLDEGGTVHTNLTSLGKHHLVALVERHGFLSLHFLASGVGTTVAIPLLDFGRGDAEVVAPPLGRRARGDEVLFYIVRDDHEVAVFRVRDELRVAIRDRAGWQIRRAVKLARGAEVLAIANTFPH